MALTLTLREQPVVPLEAEVLRPDRLAGAGRAEIEALPLWHGNERTRVREFFAVSGAGDDDVRLEGDLRRVKFVGAGMSTGPSPGFFAADVTGTSKNGADSGRAFPPAAAGGWRGSSSSSAVVARSRWETG